jgi:UPF0755 protein
MNIFTRELLSIMIRKFNYPSWALFLIVIIFGSSLMSCESIGLYFDTKKDTDNSTEKTIYLPSGTDLEDLKNILIEGGVVETADVVESLGNYKELNQDKIAPGKYTIPAKSNINDMLNGFIINSLGNGNREDAVRVTFNNCREIKDLAGKVAKHIEADSLDLLEYIMAEETLNKFGFNQATIPALFLPDTYEMYWDTDAKEFVDKMAAEFKKFWTDERKQRLKIVGLSSQSDAVTLASIIYKEQDRQPSEWPIIARLYLNRIQQGWKLESDPTFVFCWGDKLKDVQRLLEVHREIDCPYNTYKIAGLPPGPIYIPPAKVVDAVLYPDDNNYFFMCAKPDGNGLHNFANSLSEHNKNARIYQNWLSKNKIR